MLMRLMETKVVRIDGARPDLGKIKEIAAIVDAGGLVAFPTETVYGIACRVRRDCLSRLDRVKGRGPGKHYTVHISDKSDVDRYVPSVGMRAKNLIERGWPGPLTIVFALGAADMDKQRGRLGREVFDGLYKDGSVGIRCPDNLVASMLLREARGCVVAPSANITGKAAAVNAEEVLNQLDGRIDVVLDAGPCKYKQSSTVVRVGERGLEVLRKGAYSQTEVAAMSEVRVLFVCTGNTCRSPMAAGIFRRYLAEKLGCKVDEVEEAGYKISSAGVVNASGFPASAEAVTACAAMGVDVSAHSSRPLSKQLVEKSDLIFAMCRTHREQVIALSQEAGSRCSLLSEDEEIPDPIGQSQQVYDSCAALIERAVKERIRELVT